MACLTMKAKPTLIRMHTLAITEVHLQRLNARVRETVLASELVVGVQCGGSDAFSGATVNPAVGHCTDLLVVTRQPRRRARPELRRHPGQ